MKHKPKKWSRASFPSKAHSEGYGERLAPGARAIWESLTAFPRSTEYVAKRAKVSNSYARKCLRKFYEDGEIALDVVGDGLYVRYEWYVDWIPF